ncbi:MAG: S-layer homology domain-containing protein [Clostridia bacterium]|nr:S-layer homology domain-containing protein [Clostridia bacterium]
MKRRNLQRISLLLCIIYCLSFCSPLVVAKAELMNSNSNSNIELATDVEGHWAERQITYWTSKGITKGYSDGTFKPNNNITRAEFLTLVNRAFGYTQTAPVKFTDVSTRDWY